jgi:hypothetical protein
VQKETRRCREVVHTPGKPVPAPPRDKGLRLAEIALNDIKTVKILKYQLIKGEMKWKLEYN